MIIRLVKMTFRADSINQFQEMFENVRKKIINSQGCHRLDLLQDKEDKKIFFTYSIWEDAASLEAYRKSDLFKNTWMKTKANFDERPEAWSTVQLVSNLDNNEL